MSDVEQPVRHGPCRGCGDEHPIVETYSKMSGQTYGFVDCPVKDTSYLLEINREALKGYQEAMRDG